MKKCLEIPIEEQGVLMRRLNKASVLSKDEYLVPDEDFARAISFESFKEWAINHIRNLYRQK